MRRIALVLVTAIAAVAACVSIPESGPVADPNGNGTHLKDIQVAPNFMFAMTRPTTVQVKAGASTEAQRLEIRNIRSELLIEARVDANGEFVAEIPLPLGENQLTVKLGDQQQQVTLDKNGSAAVKFD